MINFIFDFDSTLVKNESLNDALELAMSENKEKKFEMEEITKMAMEGLISPEESMNRRLKLATLNKEVINKITENSTNQIVDGMKDLICYLNKNDINVFIISGGFKEIIIPTAKILGIYEKNIYANNFIYDDFNIVKGVEKNILLEVQGKVKQIRKLKEESILIGKNVMIGDGYTDLETYKYKIVDEYICFCGVISREKVINESELIAKNMDELNIFIEKMLKK